MGVKYAEGVILNIEEMWKESNVRVPMVCFLSMGSDPTNDIDQLSRKHNLSKKLIAVSISYAYKNMSK
jgi:dynein heavy chain